MNVISPLLARMYRCALSAALVSGIAVGVAILEPGVEARASTIATPTEVGSIEIAPRRWSYVWQRWDGTNYSSQATCLARGRAILKHYRDVKSISCRKPCGRWWLYTYRHQWV